MNEIIDFLKFGIVSPAASMLIVLTVISIVFKVKFSKALEAGLKLAIAITAVANVINIFSTTLDPSISRLVSRLGLNLNVQDLGWAPIATITWSSPSTIFFLLIMVLVNIAMLILNKTNTLDVDVFDIWHSAFIALFAQWCGAPLWLATLLLIFIGILKIINSDLMKPTFNELLDTPDSNPMTSTHMNYMMNPWIMIFDKIFDKLFNKLDKYDFSTASLNEKIGFWGSRFSIGIYLGIFISLLAGNNFSTINGWISMFTLCFVAATCMELFSVIGSWFTAAIEPLSQGITNFATKKLNGRTFNVGLDWPFIAGRSEVWAAANILAPIMLVEALILPGNRLLPLGGIVAMGVTPALLIVTRGKIIRMIVIGAIELPLFLWAGTITAPFVTEMARKVGAFNIPANAMISNSTTEGPVEKFLAYAIGHAWSDKGVWLLYALGAIAIYLLVFIWYARQMKKRNIEIAANRNS